MSDTCLVCDVFQDFFFYSLVYDPQQKTLLADKGEIRVGNRYQADITDLLKEGEVQAGQHMEEAGSSACSFHLGFSSSKASFHVAIGIQP